MPPRTRAIEAARRTWQRTAREVGDQLRTGRHVAGLTQRQVGRAIGVGQTEISRRERAAAPHAGAEQLAIHAAAVGLRLSIKLYPVGGALRAAAQVGAIGRFVARAGRRWRVRLEAPMPIPGDLRAVDVLLVGPSARVAVEVITRLADLQAQVRAAQLKARDIGATRLIIVATGTHANRRALAESRRSLIPSFELDTRAVLAALAAGEDPGRDAFILL
jgi:transcriptional regulator with XRE-family HTH domain